MLHNNLNNISFLEKRCKRHLLSMMYTMVSRRHDLLEKRDRERTLRSDKSIPFGVDIVTSEIHVYGKSPYQRGNPLWRQLDSNTQYAKNKVELNILLTEDLLMNLKS